MSRALFVEDNDTIREICGLMLEKSFSDLRIILAESGNIAIDLLSSDDNFDLIISDYDMPNGMGHDLLSYLIGVEAKIPFVYFTNSMEELRFSSYPFFLGVIQKDNFSTLADLIQKKIGHQLN